MSDLISYRIVSSPSDDNCSICESSSDSNEAATPYDCYLGLEVDHRNTLPCGSGVLRKPKTIRRRRKNKKSFHRSLNLKSTSVPTVSLNNSAPTTCRSITTTTIPSSAKSINRNSTDLCEIFDVLTLAERRRSTSSRLQNAFVNLPEHDKRILHRMAAKRKADLVRREDALIAREYWDLERNHRTALCRQQNEQLKSMLRCKQAAERRETEHRIRKLAEENRTYLSHVQAKIAAKERQVERRLAASAMAKELRLCEQSERKLNKVEMAIVNAEQSGVDTELRKQHCYDVMEKRISRATELRTRYLATQQRRLNASNDREQSMHAAKYDRVKQLEEHKEDELRARIREQDRKCNDFLMNKHRQRSDARDLAKTSLELRDLVRRSISPDNYSLRTTTLRAARNSSRPNEQPLSSRLRCDRAAYGWDDFK